MEDWALIRRLAAEGVPKVRIAERLGVSRSTVIKAVASDAPPKYVRRAAEATSFTPFEARVRWLLDETLSPGIIPALAGSTAPSSPWTKHGPDHPRVGGEHCWMVASGIGGSGSSPRWRGARSRSRRPSGRARIIPALAGSTARSRRAAPASRDHPRVGGEHSVSSWASSARSGSSPRWRGAQLRGAALLEERRIIPALAGSTGRPCDKEDPEPDHPRVGGEHEPDRGHLRRGAGSSPRWRGAREDPASGLRVESNGSSPRWRGARRRRPRRAPGRGIIPALAGSTSQPGPATTRSRDHPRVGGEHVDQGVGHQGAGGSSPRWRGARHAPGPSVASSRIIPALAGSTPGSRRSRRR